MSINCEPKLVQLEKLVKERVLRNIPLASSDVDLNSLIASIIANLKPTVLTRGLSGINLEIDDKIADAVFADSNSSEESSLSTGHHLCNDSHFVLSNWISTDGAPLMSNRIANLKRLHKEILVPIVDYYKANTDDKFIKEQCILKILTGLSTDSRLNTTPVGDMSLHYMGKAVNFRLTGIDDEVIIDDLKNKRIPVNVGVFSNPHGIFLTLPYDVNGTRIENLYVFKDKRGSLSYEFI